MSMITYRKSAHSGIDPGAVGTMCTLTPHRASPGLGPYPDADRYPKIRFQCLEDDATPTKRHASVFKRWNGRQEGKSRRRECGITKLEFGFATGRLYQP